MTPSPRFVRLFRSLAPLTRLGLLCWFLIPTGKKNGEKRLRALLCRTREWNSVEERARLAALCSSRAASAAPGGPMATSMTRLAAALRAKRSAALAKAHLLFCVRAWGYASDVWFRHGRATRAREMAAVADAEAMARARTRATPEQEREPAPHEDDDDGDEGSQDRGEVPTADAEPEPPSEPPSAAELRLMGGGFPWDVGFNVRELSVADATAEIERQLRPLALAATALIAGPDACAAARTLGASHISVHDLAEVRKAVAHTASFHRWYLGVRATVQNELAAAVAADGGAPSPAWRRLAGRDTPVEASLRGFAARLRSAAMRNCPHAFFAAPHIVDAMRGGELAHAPVCDGGERAALPPCSSDGSHEDSCLSGVPREATEHDAALAAGASASDKRLAATRRWLNEMFRGLCASVELATRLQLLVTDAKLAAHTTFWEVSLLVTDTMLLFTSASSEAFARRAAWMAEVLVASAPPLLDGASFEAPAAPAAKPRLLFEFMSSCGDSCGSSPAAASVSDA